MGARKGLLSLVLGALLLVVVSFGLWPKAVETLAVVITSVVIAVTMGIPVGVLMAEFDRVRALLEPVLDAMQTMPSFVYLIPALMLFGMGKVPAVLATLIYSVPPVIRLTNLGIRCHRGRSDHPGGGPPSQDSRLTGPPPSPPEAFPPAGGSGSAWKGLGP